MLTLILYAILLPDIDLHGHTRPASDPRETGKAEARNQVGGKPWCARRTLPANIRKRLFVGRVRRAHHVRKAFSKRWGNGCALPPDDALRK